MATSVKEIAILENTVLELTVVNHHLRGVERLILYKLNLVMAKWGRWNLNLLQG